jgi:endonuclease III
MRLLTSPQRLEHHTRRTGKTTSMSDTVIKELLDRHGRTYAEQLGIDVAANTPAPLFRLLCFSLLAAARISTDIAVAAAAALADAGLNTVDKMAASTWRQRTDILNTAGYARYDESTSRTLGATAELLADRYGGDLRELRAQADGDLGELRRRITECKGIGDVGADIFLREVQVAWEEVYPFIDDRTLRVARQLGLDDDAAALARSVSRSDFAHLVAALVRTGLAGDDEIDTIRAAG